LNDEHEDGGDVEEVERGGGGPLYVVAQQAADRARW
jgi:hypothetical protein